MATSPPAATIYQFLNCDFSDQNWHITCNDCSFVWPVTSLLRMELPSWIVALQNDNGMNNKQRLRTREETNKDGDFSDQNWHITCNDCSFVWPVTSLLRMELPSWIVALQNDTGMNNKQRLRTPEETNKDGEHQKKKAANRLSKSRSVTGRAGRSLRHVCFSAPMSIMSD